MLKGEININFLFEKVFKENDYKSFELIFHHYYDNLCNYALKYVSSPEIAEEVVSDVFFKLWKNRDRINIESSFQSYLFTSVRNQSLDYLRSQQKLKNKFEEVNSNMGSFSSNPEESYIQEELNKKIEEAIGFLPNQCRIIFRMSRDEGLKYKEISEALNISIKTVETQMGRALKKLKESLKEMLSLLLATYPFFF